jgi:hypothetical protein
VLKVANIAEGNFVKLTTDQLTAFAGYISRVKVAGVPVLIVSEADDELAYHIDIYYNPQVLNAHVKICYLAYVLLSYLNFYAKKMDLSANTVLEQMQAVYKENLKSEKANVNWSKTVTLTKQQHKILAMLDCSV